MRLRSPRLALLTFSHFAIDSYSSFLSPLLPLLIQKLDLSLTLVGTLVALSSIASSLAQPLFGFLADFLRRPWFIVFGPLCAGTFLCAVGLAPSYGSLVALVMLGGIGVAAFHPQAAVLVGTLLERRGMAMSIFVSGGTIGFSAGPLIAVSIVGLFGLERTWLWGLTVIPITVMLLFWLRRVAPTPRRVGARPALRELTPVARPVIALYFSAVCRSAASYGFMTFLPIHLARRGHAFQFGGIVVSAYLTAGAIGALVGGWLADRWGGRRVIVTSFIGGIPLYFAYLVLPESAGLACVVLGNFMLQLALPVVVVMGQAIAPRHASTVSSLLMGAAWGMSLLLVGPAGALADAHGLPVAFAGLAGMLVVGLMFALTLPDARTSDAQPEVVPA